MKHKTPLNKVFSKKYHNISFGKFFAYFTLFFIELGMIALSIFLSWFAYHIGSKDYFASSFSAISGVLLFIVTSILIYEVKRLHILKEEDNDPRPPNMLTTLNTNIVNYIRHASNTSFYQEHSMRKYQS